MKLPKYYFRMLVFTLLISTVPILLLGIFSSIIASSNLLKNVTVSTQQLLSQTELTVEQNLRVIDTSMTQFTNLPIVIQAAKTPLHAREFLTVWEIKRYMDYALSSEMGVESVYYINIAQGWAIYPNKVFHLNEFEMNTIEQLHNAFSGPSYLLEYNQYSNVQLKPIEIPHAVLLVKSIPLYPPTKYMVIAQIGFDQLNKWIADSENLGSTIIMNNQFHVIGSNIKDKSKYGTLEKIITDELLHVDEPSGNFKTNYLDEDVYVFFKKSNYTDWIYLSVVPKSLITQKSRAIGWVTMLTCAGLICLMFYLSYKGSNRMYSPIKRLFLSFLMDNQNTTSLDEIELITSSLTNMKQQIFSQAKELHIYYVLKLFHGELQQNEIKEKILDTHQKFDQNGKFAVFTLQVDTFEGTCYPDSDRDLLLFATMNIVQETIPESKRISPVVIHQSLVCLIALENNYDNKYKTQLITYGAMIQKNIEEYLSLSASIGISRIFDQLHMAYNAYEEGLSALKYKVKLGNRSLIFIDDVEPGANYQGLRYPAFLSNQLQDAIKLNDQHKAEQLLEEFIQYIFQQEGTLTDYHMILIRLLSNIMRLYHPENDNASMILHGQSLPKELLDIHTPEEILTWFKEKVVGPVMKLIQEKTELHNKRISDEMIRRIEQGDITEISLESIGIQLNYSPAYLSQVFRKEVGIPFTEYLTAHRINMAKTWLIETDISVNEIARKLNYTNAQNFIRSFKKEVGTTPGKYRKLHE